MTFLHAFGPPDTWPDQDMIAFSDEISLDMTLAAYLSGAFPMPLTHADFEGRMCWWSPTKRGILELDSLRITRSLIKSARRYTTTIDRAFAEVLDKCADPSRAGSWITDDIRRIFTEAHELGVVHSVETWDCSGRLVGGLYGVSLGGLFAGESMFHDPKHGRDSSKVALTRLVAELQTRPDNVGLLDVQWVTEHLESLGAMEISREDYLGRLAVALDGEQMAWSTRRLPGDHELVRTA